MKKFLATVIVVGAFGASAFAGDGDSVIPYGTLDIAVGGLEHSPNASPLHPATVNPVNKVSTKFDDPVYGMFNGGISDSRWGLRGTENLDPNLGLQAFFDLESGFDVPSGELNNAAGAIAGSSNTMAAASALSGQLFNRGAYLGLKQDEAGSLEFGRTPTFNLETIVNYDPLFAAQLFSPLGFSGSYSGGGITEGSRTDNNIKYTNHIGPVNVGASYSLGGISGNFGAGSAASVNLGYEAHGFGIQGIYYRDQDVLHSSALAGTNSPSSPVGTSVGALTLNNDYDVMVAAKYSFGSATLKAGYEYYKLQAPSDPDSAGTTVDYFGYSGTVTNTVNPTNVNVYFAGGDYKFTPQFDVAVGFYDTQTLKSTGVNGGDQFQYSLLPDYHFSHRTDVYAGCMYSQFTGSAFTGDEPSNLFVALGIRMMFRGG